MTTGTPYRTVESLAYNVIEIVERGKIIQHWRRWGEKPLGTIRVR